MYPRLKIFRESLGLTQEEFGKSLNIAKSTYNNYETGIRDPKSDFWIAVAKKYNVTIDYLMGFSDDRHKLPEEQKEMLTSIHESEQSAEEKELIRLYDLASPELKAAALAVLRTAEADHKSPDADAKEK